MDDDETYYVFCRACHTYFPQDELGSHDKFCTASKSVIKKFVGNRYDMVSASEVPDELKQSKYQDYSSQSKSNLLESTFQKSKGKFNSFLKSSKGFNLSFNNRSDDEDTVKPSTPKEDSMIFLCNICGRQLDQDEIGDHISECSVPEGYIGSQFTVLDDALEQAEQEQDTKKKEETDNDINFICTVCGAQLTQSECIPHTKTCKQPKGMNGSQFFLLEPDTPAQPLKETQNQEDEQDGEKKKKKRRKHHRTEGEESGTTELSVSPVDAATSPVDNDITVSSTVSTSDLTPNQIDDISVVDSIKEGGEEEPEKKKRRKHRKHREGDATPDAEASPEPIVSTPTETTEQSKEPSYICNVCGHMVSQSECMDHMTTCHKPKSMTQSQFILLEDTTPDTSTPPPSLEQVPISTPAPEENTEELSADMEGEKKKKRRRKHRSEESKEEEVVSPSVPVDITPLPEITPEPTPASIPEEPVEEEEPVYICGVCGKSMSQIECIDHTIRCKPPKGFTGSQFIKVEEDKPAPKRISIVQAVQPKTLEELKEQGKQMYDKGEPMAPLKQDTEVVKKDDFFEESTDEEVKEVAAAAPSPAPTPAPTRSVILYELSDSDDDDQEMNISALSPEPLAVSPKPILIEEDYKNPFAIRDTKGDLYVSTYLPESITSKLKETIHEESEEKESPVTLSTVLAPFNPLSNAAMENVLDSQTLMVQEQVDTAIDSLSKEVEKEQGVIENKPILKQSLYSTSKSTLSSTLPSSKEESKSLLEIAEERRKKEEEEYKKLVEQQRLQKLDQEKKQKEEEERREQERLAELKRKRDIENAKKSGLMQMQKNYISFISWMEVGCICRKHCTKGDTHQTLLKIKTFNQQQQQKNSLSWQRKKGLFKSREASILLNTVTDIKTSGPRRIVVQTEKRSYLFEFYTKEEGDKFINGLKNYLEYVKL
ncbi:hypothetical protein WA158_001248 [Blastocystis sp. Blastoise]